MLVVNDFSQIAKVVYGFPEKREVPLDNGTCLYINDKKGIKYWSTGDSAPDITEIQLVFIEHTGKVFPEKMFTENVLIDNKVVTPNDTLKDLQEKFNSNLKQDTDSLKFGILIYEYNYFDLQITFTLKPDNEGLRNLNIKRYTQNKLV
jgi:hypothetical protein